MAWLRAKQWCLLNGYGLIDEVQGLQFDPRPWGRIYHSSFQKQYWQFDFLALGACPTDLLTAFEPWPIEMVRPVGDHRTWLHGGSTTGSFLLWLVSVFWSVLLFQDAEWLDSIETNLSCKISQTLGGRHSSVVLSVPIILRPQVWTPSLLFQFILFKLKLHLYLEWEKGENKPKRGWDWPI